LALESVDDATARDITAKAIASGKLTVDEVSAATIVPKESAVKSIAGAVADELRGSLGTRRSAGPDAGAVFNTTASRVRVKRAKEDYLRTKSVAAHVKTGQAVADETGQPCMTVSELEFAKGGAFLKHIAKKSGVAVRFTDHEKDLLEDCFTDQWVGLFDGEWRKDISGLECKTLLSDSTSGGINANPAWFDSSLITYPLLSGELFPLVDLKEVPRGASVEGASIDNPTSTWGTESGTAISLFNTDDMMDDVNTSIHTLSVAVEVGRDFLSDAAGDVGTAIMTQIGEEFKKELDKVIAIGNGASQPEGVFTASGIGSVTTGGTWGINDVEALLFGIGKQYRTSNRCAFLSNDTSYARVQAVPTGIASDNTRIFGNNHEGYEVLKRSWRIQNDIANTKAGFGDFGRYRMYRRLGYQIEVVTTGATLARSNKVLYLARARYGGRVVDPSAFTAATDCQA
jgi:HK97 family phage major capsid protein